MPKRPEYVAWVVRLYVLEGTDRDRPYFKLSHETSDRKFETKDYFGDYRKRTKR